jgi:hypothetical protein
MQGMRKPAWLSICDGRNGCPGQTIRGVVHEREWLPVECIPMREWCMDGFAVWEHEWYSGLLLWATA